MGVVQSSMGLQSNLGVSNPHYISIMGLMHPDFDDDWYAHREIRSHSQSASVSNPRYILSPYHSSHLLLQTSTGTSSVKPRSNIVTPRQPPALGQCIPGFELSDGFSMKFMIRSLMALAKSQELVLIHHTDTFFRSSMNILFSTQATVLSTQIH